MSVPLGDNWYWMPVGSFVDGDSKCNYMSEIHRGSQWHLYRGKYWSCAKGLRQTEANRESTNIFKCISHQLIDLSKHIVLFPTMNCLQRKTQSNLVHFTLRWYKKLELTTLVFQSCSLIDACSPLKRATTYIIKNNFLSQHKVFVSKAAVNYHHWLDQ